MTPDKLPLISGTEAAVLTVIKHVGPVSVSAIHYAGQGCLSREEISAAVHALTAKGYVVEHGTSSWSGECTYLSTRLAHRRSTVSTSAPRGRTTLARISTAPA